MDEKSLKHLKKIIDGALVEQEIRFDKKFKDIKKSIGDSEAAIISTITNNL